MADINARLKTTPNGPGPQHKKEGANEFEFTEGKDGKLNVRDVDVKAELELIKQQQQQILQRLDSPIETQLTGSKVEERLINDSVKIQPGSYYLANINMSDFSAMTIGYYNPGNTFPLRVRYREGSVEGHWLTPQTDLFSTDSSVASSDIIAVTSQSIGVFIYNDGETEATIINLVINKVKGGV